MSDRELSWRQPSDRIDGPRPPQQQRSRPPSNRGQSSRENRSRGGNYGTTDDRSYYRELNDNDVRNNNRDQPVRGRVQYHHSGRRGNAGARHAESSSGTIDVSKYRFISKLDHGDDSGDSLKSRMEQQRLFDHIKERPQAESDTLLLYRKLREGVTSSGVTDEFVVDVYRHAAQCALSAKDLAEYHVCALSLVTRIFPALEDLEKHRDLYCFWVSQVILYYACCAGNVYEISKLLPRIPLQQQQSDSVRFAMTVLGAIETDNYIAFHRLHRQADAAQKALMTMALPKLRRQTMNIVRKAYLGLETQYLTTTVLAINSVQATDEYIANEYNVPEDAYSVDRAFVTFKGWSVK